jgi:hypothetical protein
MIDINNNTWTLIQEKKKRLPFTAAHSLECYFKHLWLAADEE